MEDTTAPPQEFLIGAQNSVAAEDGLTVIPKVKGTFIKLNTGANASVVPQRVKTAPGERRVQSTADSCWKENLLAFWQETRRGCELTFAGR